MFIPWRFRVAVLGGAGESCDDPSYLIMMRLLSCSEVHGVRSCALFSLVGLRRGARLGALSAAHPGPRASLKRFTLECDTIVSLCIRM